MHGDRCFILHRLASASHLANTEREGDKRAGVGVLVVVVVVVVGGVGGGGGSMATITCFSVVFLLFFKGRFRSLTVG